MRVIISMLIMGALIVSAVLYFSNNSVLAKKNEKEQEHRMLYQSALEREGGVTVVVMTPVERACVLCTVCLFKNLEAKYRTSRITLLRKSMHPT